MLGTLQDLLGHLPPEGASIAGTWVAAVLTLAILSRILGRNMAFRFAEYLFVGVAAGYAVALAWTSVLAPRLRLLAEEPSTYWYYAVFFSLGLMLMCRSVRSLTWLGDIPLAVLFGTGAGLALGGALTGSLIGQVRGTLVSMSPKDYGGGVVGWAYALDAVLLVLGTVAVFGSYQFGRRQSPLGGVWYAILRPLAGLGRGFILVAFGALLGSALLSFFAILVGRLDFLVNDWLGLFGNMGL